MQKGRTIKYKVNYYTRMQILYPILFLYYSVKKENIISGVSYRLLPAGLQNHLSDSGEAPGVWQPSRVCPFCALEPSLCTVHLPDGYTHMLELEENRKEQGCLVSWGFLKQSNCRSSLSSASSLFAVMGVDF